MPTHTTSSLQLALRAKQARLQQPDANLLQSEPIAIVGLSCRFPGGSDTPEAFWQTLRDGVDAITEVPADRWPVDEFYDPDPAAPGRMSTRSGGFLGRIDSFDAQFFGIAPREAAGMDPQQRLLLEVAIEAIDDAGLTRSMLAGSQTGVFAAVYGIDYGMWHMSHAPGIDAYTILGTAHCIASGRLSFLLDLHGPSLVVDTGCSSSLVAVHLACQSLRAGDCSVAVAGAVGLMLSPEWTISLSKWGFMAPDGRCKTFDRRADGFVRGEGCGVVVLKRLADALADGDRVLSVIRGTAVNEDGRSTVLTSPSGPAQEAVIRQALANGRVEAADVTYVEAHGTGTALGDPIELEALAAVYGVPGDGTACRVGSVKANIGHLEAAAGMAGLIKTVLAIQHRSIPPQPHLRELTPHVSLGGTRIEVAAPGRDWSVPAGRSRMAGVSSFGFGGTNAHVVVEEAPTLPAAGPVETTAWLVPISARTDAALREVASRWSEILPDADAARLRDLCFTASVRRTHWEHRAAVVGTTGRELADAMAALARGEGTVHAATGRRPAGGRRHGPVFVFSGQGPQWWGMGRRLLEADRDYRHAIDAVAAVMDPLTGWSLVAEFGRDEEHSRVQQTEFAQPMIFAMQVALAAALRARGIEPAAVVGHSVGEIAAAHVAGVLPLDAAVRIVVHRARVMQRATGLGRMVSVAIDEEAATALAGRFGRALSVAAVNAPRSVVLSGEAAAVNAVVADLEARAVGCRMLPVDYAFHSAQMAALAADLRAGLDDLAPPGVPVVPIVSTVTGRPAVAADYGPDYWVRNMVSPVRFSDAIASLHAAGHDTFVETGPHPVLAAAMRETVGESAVVVGVQQRSRDAVVSFASAIGHLFAVGHDPDWRRLFAGGRVVSLPAYPWQRQRYWIDRPVPRARTPEGPPSWPGRQLHSPAITAGMKVFEIDLSSDTPTFVQDHRIQDVLVFPAAGYVTLMLAAAATLPGIAAELNDVSFGEPLLLRDDVTRVQVIVVQGSHSSARVVSLDAGTGRWIEHAAGLLRTGGEARPAEAASAPVVPAGDSGRDAHYAALVARGCVFGPSFRRIRAIADSADTAVAAIDAAPQATDVTGSALQPGVLDACFQAAAALLPEASETYVPFAIGALRVHGTLAGSLSARARTTARSVDALTTDLEVFDASGALMLEVHAFRLQRAHRDAMRAREQDDRFDSAMLGLEWDIAAPAAGERAGRGRWMVIGDDEAFAARVVAALRARGHVAAHAGAGHLASGEPPTGVIVLAAGTASLARVAVSDDVIQPAMDAAERARVALQSAIAALPLADGIEVVTRAAQATGREAGPVNLAHAALLGMARVAASEHPDVLVRRIDLESEPSVDEALVLAELATSTSPESELAFRQGEWITPRLVGLAAPSVRDAGPRRLEVAERGSIDGLAFAPLVRRGPGPHEVEVRVRATGLNFRDVLNVLGTYPGDVGHPGDDFAGVVTAVGSGVTDLTPGDAVVGLAPGAFATHVTAPATRLARKPSGLPFAHAAAVPSTFMTAAWALHELAKVRPGERVLIHAAAGGVGLAAVQLARRAGAEVFATAGSETKRDLLRSLGVVHVMSSRSGDFADEIMTTTGGQGVDVVLNSLSGDLIARSLACLGRGGRFVEIGRTGILDAADVARLRPDVQYHVLFLLDVFERDAKAFRALLEPLLEDVAAGRLAPLPARTFAFDAAVDGFRFMANARHVGKVVVVQADSSHGPLDPVIRPDATYIVTGAHGAIGRRVVDWLVGRGARHLLLIGRRDPSGARHAAWASVKDSVSIVSLALDVSSPTAPQVMAAALADMPPPAGVLHLAGALGDAVLSDLSAAQLAATFAPKVAGAWHLHQVTMEAPLDFFVVFSGGTSLLGLPGQTAYAGANAFLDAFAHYRRVWDLPAVAINWGPWAGEGMAASMTDRDRRRFATRGMSAISAETGLAILGNLIAQPSAAQVGVMPVDWAAYVREAPMVRRLALRLLARDAPATTPAPVATESILARLQAVPAAGRREALTAAVRETALRVLGLASTEPLDPHQGLRDVGLDSLTALELRNRLQQAIGRPLPATLAFDHPTVAALGRYLADVLGLGDDRDREGLQETPAATGGDIETLSDDEAEALLARELSGLDHGGRDGN